MAGICACCPECPHGGKCKDSSCKLHLIADSNIKRYQKKIVVYLKDKKQRVQVREKEVSIIYLNKDINPFQPIIVII